MGESGAARERVMAEMLVLHNLNKQGRGHNNGQICKCLEESLSLMGTFTCKKKQRTQKISLKQNGS